jgi:hypothetical protein
MPGRVRRPGAGRKSIVESDPKLLASLDRLIEPDTRGDPESPLRWTCKSTRNLAAQLTRQKHSVSHVKVAQLLRDQNYSLQSNRKTEEGADHPDRDAQFRHISAQVKRALATETPVISVDTKKKELCREPLNSSYERGCQEKNSPVLPCEGKLFALHPAHCLRRLRGCVPGAYLLSVTRPVAGYISSVSCFRWWFDAFGS